MTNMTLGFILLSILGLSISKIIAEKKKGVKCIGCPYAGMKGKENCSCELVQFGK